MTRESMAESCHSQPVSTHHHSYHGPPPSIVESHSSISVAGGSGHYCQSFEPPTNQQYPTPILSPISIPPHHLCIEPTSHAGGTTPIPLSPLHSFASGYSTHTLRITGTLKELRLIAKKATFVGHKMGAWNAAGMVVITMERDIVPCVTSARLHVGTSTKSTWG